MSELKVLRAQSQHLGTASDLLQPIYREAYPNGNGIVPEMFDGIDFMLHLRDYLRGKITSDKADLYIGFIGCEALGTIGIEVDPEEPETGEIWGFYVDTDRQNQGIGRFLWEDLMAREEVARLNKLRLTVAKNLKTAINFYEREGFERVGEEVWQWPSWTEPKGRNEYWVMERSKSI